ncbi:hypothetical protein EDI_129060 [Entamoeba dispar SAW760]|uniref:Uncharacterized protein n=1 Tax=Entamoeba dispar (strain ATCC PRA-260 / SAW760) TaxID=370354 RepID=B0ETG8_ENTDS|nr:uncharacterized protein EDI_129060 [Entamoeba dispar SAW760]EDR22153.1 hypothetical protein EDI_129060 [Entamoeba dispar SAW760]|eukprot:EDR22153.1 hypothetical protein EDI_129060 [Entamoeba dispar SAW760]
MIFWLLILSTLGVKCSKGLYEYNNNCLPMCGDEILAGWEECDGGSGCELNCSCAFGWKRDYKGGCVPSSNGLSVGFSFVIELEKDVILKENLFRYELENEIFNAYNYELKNSYTNISMSRDEVIVKAFTKDQINNKTIEVKFKLTGSSTEVPVYVDYFNYMISNYSSFWYSQNSTYLKVINPIEPVHIFYQVDPAEFNGIIPVVILFSVLSILILI